MTIAELKEKIKDLPDDMLVGDTGHYGEYLDIDDIWIYDPNKDGNPICCICIEDAGEEPD